MRYSVQTRHRIFVKVYGFLYFAKNMGKNMSKNMSGKYSQQHLYHVEQSPTDTFKTASKRAIPRAAEATVDLISNKIADKTTNTQKTHKKIIQKTVANMSMIKKYLKKDIYLQKKDKKLSII